MNLQSFLYARNLAMPASTDPSTLWGQNYELALDITRGLGYLHSQRIIHRDVKLHNVVLGERRRCRLIDFGLARRAKYWKSSVEEPESRVVEGEG
jgi:serine/threonine protein kinase